MYKAEEVVPIVEVPVCDLFSTKRLIPQVTILSVMRWLRDLTTYVYPLLQY